RFFERFSCPLMRAGDVVGRVWSFRDITQRKRAEEGQLALQRQLEKAQRMESLGLLAGGVAHDLNNLLGPLVAYPEMILEELADDHPVREDIIRMGKSAEQASTVIQDLLAMARRGRYEMQPTDLNDVISSFLDSIAFRDVRSRRSKVVVESVLASTPQVIQGSAPHLTKVIMNLIGNAIEACPVDGRVAVTTESKHLSQLYSGYSNIPEGEYVVLRIIDTGNGIAPEDIGKIFEPYFSKKKMGRSGSGLGLAVVHGIVRDHSGYYDVTSKVGQGTEFTFYFPMIGEQKPVALSAIQDVRGRETVLVVDDDQDQRALSTRLITSLGYHVTTAAGGEEAYAYLKDHDADILVLDMIMEPGIDGLDTYRKILSIKPEQRAIIATGFSSTDRVREMQRLGAGACISKPYHRDQIGQAIRDELSRRAFGTAVSS
ncbi:MAG: ATP-binding protein, partial [Candidatus Zixiibacteriota bacterium]